MRAPLRAPTTTREAGCRRSSTSETRSARGEARIRGGGTLPTRDRMTNPLNFADKRTILVVDDGPDNLTLLSGVLKDEYKVKVANSGARALQALQGGPLPDLV